MYPAAAVLPGQAVPHSDQGSHDKLNFETTKQNKANQLNSPDEDFFPKKNWLPKVGFEPTTFWSLYRLTSLPTKLLRQLSIYTPGNQYSRVWCTVQCLVQLQVVWIMMSSMC